MAKKKAITKRSHPLPDQRALLDDLRTVIEEARQQTARAVNSSLVLKYCQTGKRIRKELLGNERAEYGKEIVSALSA